MTQIVLPITSRANTDPNLFSDTYSNDSAISTVVNGDLRNDNLAAAGTANIAIGKLAAGSSAQLIVCNASGVPTYRTLSGDATITAAGGLSLAATKIQGARKSFGSVPANGTNVTDTITWGSAFPDANYTVTIGVQTSGTSPVVYAVTAKTASSITVAVQIFTIGAAATITVHAIGIHD